MPRRSDVALTIRAIERLRPRDVKYAVHDSRVTGLMVVVHPSGRKVFAARYVTAAGTRRNKTLGSCATTTLETARKRAGAMIDAAGDGADPVAQQRQARAKARAAGTYETVVDRFVTKYAKPRQRTWKETERVLKASGKAWLKRPFAEIAEEDAYDVLDAILADGMDATARVTLAWWRTLWRWAWKRKYAAAPVMDAVDIEIERRVRTRRYSDDEIRMAWAAAEGLAPVEGAYIKLCILLVPRRTELAKAARTEMDEPAKPALWTIPFARTKSKKKVKRERPYLVPLPPLAQRIFRSIPKREDAEDLYFPGRRKGRPLVPGTPLKKKLRAASGIDDWTFHACRDTAASWLQDRGYDEYQRGLVLNHAGPGSVTADYSHGYALDLKRKLLEEWADHVAGVVKPEGVAVLS